MKNYLAYVIINLLILILPRRFAYNREKTILTIQTICFMSFNLLLNLNPSLSILEKLDFFFYSAWISILFLEIWSMTNDGYTFLLLILAGNTKIRKLNLTDLEALIYSTKSNDRKKSLERLKIIRKNGEKIYITRRGENILTFISILRRILLIR